MAARAIEQNCIQELAVVIAPKLLGGTSARTPLDDLGFISMNDVVNLDKTMIKKLDSDWLFHMLLPKGKY